jgi:hypothetical protein
VSDAPEGDDSSAAMKHSRHGTAAEPPEAGVMACEMVHQQCRADPAQKMGNVARNLRAVRAGRLFAGCPFADRKSSGRDAFRHAHGSGESFSEGRLMTSLARKHVW